MKLEEAQKLTDEELRIKVAELCGWEMCPNSKKVAFTGKDTDEGQILKAVMCHAGEQNGYGSGGRAFVLPDYPNDLNAMHEAEVQAGLVSDAFNSGYWEALSRCAGDIPIICATARQRCIAFIMTMKGEQL